MNILGVWEVWQWRGIVATEKLSNFADTIGSIVEEKDSVVVCVVSFA
jgi:hypothetical protein